MLMVSMEGFAQSASVQLDAAKQAVYREKIGLDMSVPDFNVKKIDEKVMGSRLAGLLDYLLENYYQGTNERLISQVLGEKVEALKSLYIHIKKMQFVSATKKGNEISIQMKLWLDENSSNVKQADLSMLFKDGVSDSKNVNDMFTNMSRYVQAREQMINRVSREKNSSEE